MKQIDKLKLRLQLLSKSTGYIFDCRFHPTDWFHEVGCPHMTWTAEQLEDMIIKLEKLLKVDCK